MKLSVLECNNSTIELTKIGTYTLQYLLSYFVKIKTKMLQYDKIFFVLDKIVPQVGRNIIGLVQVPCSERGLVLKLPFGYHGSVAVTDLTDVYVQVPLLFQKLCKSKFLKCHVLEVNHQTKYCQLSLRKSRYV